VATAQCRSRQNSYEQARSAIAETVDKIVITQYNKNTSQDRRAQVGSGMRGDKIRTYRFQDDRVQDHRSEKTATVSSVLKGNFDQLWNQ
jgi:peptide chain release factor 1